MCRGISKRRLLTKEKRPIAEDLNIKESILHLYFYCVNAPLIFPKDFEIILQGYSLA